jgi:hypothetical protein
LDKRIEDGEIESVTEIKKFPTNNGIDTYFGCLRKIEDYPFWSMEQKVKLVDCLLKRSDVISDLNYFVAAAYLKQDNWKNAKAYLNDAIQDFISSLPEKDDFRLKINQIFLLILFQLAYIDLKLEENASMSEALIKCMKEYFILNNIDTDVEAFRKFYNGMDTLLKCLKNKE